ncbi:hypothetical protein SDC9_177818 [bioreactor metagenome]|uniref:Uncharacterized protein n=1 Tax=bioreactor metagenome TaxID=1076179 RepID=A0A645GUB8_9ZZZZ
MFISTFATVLLDTPETVPLKGTLIVVVAGVVVAAVVVAGVVVAAVVVAAVVAGFSAVTASAVADSGIAVSGVTVSVTSTYPLNVPLVLLSSGVLLSEYCIYFSIIVNAGLSKRLVSTITTVFSVLSQPII